MATEQASLFTRVNSAAGWILNRREGSVIVGLVSLYLVGLWVDPGVFLTLGRLNNILRDAALVAIMGYGVAMLMITAEFDLSVGALLGLSGGLTLILIKNIGVNGPFAVLVVLVFGVLYGISQGLIVTQLNLPSLIVTIGTLTGVRGALQIAIGTTTIDIPYANLGILQWFGGNILLGDLPGLEAGYELQYQLPVVHDSVQSFDRFSIMIIWMFVFLAIFHYMLFRTRFGYHVRATGDNIESAGTTGIDPEIVKIACFAIVGLLTAFAGIAFAGRATSIQASSGDGQELFVIAAVVLGGTKLTGGEGSMVGALLGALVLTVADYVLRALGLGVSGWQAVITGGFIVAAVGLDVVFRGFSIDLLRRWYIDPIREMLVSPSEFFRTGAVRKTAAELYGFIFVAIGVTAILTNVVAGILGIKAVQSALFPDGLVSFMLVLQGNWPETVIQVYLFLLFLAVVSFLAIELVTQQLEGTGDYENSLSIAAYSMLFAPLFAIPIAMYGFDISFIQSGLIDSLLVALPVFVGMLWVMYVGVVELHELNRQRALATVGSVVAVLFVCAGLIAWSLMNVSPIA
jgi:ribose/xylose/arabinose/galactoside ABC-type transport system permease subunit